MTALSRLPLSESRPDYFSFARDPGGITVNCGAEKETTPSRFQRFRSRLVSGVLAWLSPILNLRAGAFKQFRKIVDIGSARVADHEIAKSTLAPCCHVERQLFCHGRALVPSTPQRSFLEHENRNLVFPHRVDQMCAGCLTEVGHAASHEGKLGILDFRQIEGEGDFSLKPRF